MSPLYPSKHEQVHTSYHFFLPSQTAKEKKNKERKKGRTRTKFFPSKPVKRGKQSGQEHSCSTYSSTVGPTGRAYDCVCACSYSVLMLVKSLPSDETLSRPRMMFAPRPPDPCSFQDYFLFRVCSSSFLRLFLFFFSFSFCEFPLYMHTSIPGIPDPHLHAATAFA